MHGHCTAISDASPIPKSSRKCLTRPRKIQQVTVHDIQVQALHERGRQQVRLWVSESARHFVRIDVFLW